MYLNLFVLHANIFLLLLQEAAVEFPAHRSDVYPAAMPLMSGPDEDRECMLPLNQDRKAAATSDGATATHSRHDNGIADNACTSKEDQGSPEHQLSFVPDSSAIEYVSGEADFWVAISPSKASQEHQQRTQPGPRLAIATLNSAHTRKSGQKHQPSQAADVQGAHARQDKVSGTQALAEGYAAIRAPEPADTMFLPDSFAFEAAQHAQSAGSSDEDDQTVSPPFKTRLPKRDDPTHEHISKQSAKQAGLKAGLQPHKHKSKSQRPHAAQKGSSHHPESVRSAKERATLPATRQNRPGKLVCTKDSLQGAARTRQGKGLFSKTVARTKRVKETRTTHHGPPENEHPDWLTDQSANKVYDHNLCSAGTQTFSISLSLMNKMHATSTGSSLIRHVSRKTPSWQRFTSCSIAIPEPMYQQMQQQQG